MSSPVFLAVDSGTSCMKVALLNKRGDLLALETAELSVAHPFEGASEADMPAIWETLCSLLQALGHKQAAYWPGLQGICVAGQGDGCWPLAVDGEPLRPAMLWNDTRTRQVQLKNNAAVEQYCSDHSLTQLFPGAAPMLLLWLKEHEPEKYARLRWVLHCKDWLNYKLTGVAATDYSDSSTALLNVRTCQYDPGLLDLLGIAESSSFFPPVLPPGSLLGKVSEPAARRCGLPPGLPVVMGSIDVAAVALGAGVMFAGEALTIVGTTLCNEVVMEEKDIDPSERRGSVLHHAVAGRLLRVMATSSGTSSLDWARQTVASGKTFAEIETAITALPVGSEGVLFHPYLYGERAPFRSPLACGGFYGLSARHTPMHLLRAVYEGLAMMFVDCYQALPAVKHVVVAGGGAKSEALCRILADSLGKPILRTGIAELGIYGAYRMLLQGLGSTPATQMLDPGSRQEFLPDPGRHENYAALYRIFVDLRQSILPYWVAREDWMKVNG